MSDHLSMLEEYRGLREALEASILPLATSVDGRRFEYQASLHGLDLEAGGYVALDAGGEVRLGQVLIAERYRAATFPVGVRSGTSDETRIGIRFRDLGPAAQAAVLRLDPVSDRAEYADLTALVEDEGVRSVEDLARSSAEALKLRARNLGADRGGVWPGADGESLPDEVVSRAAPRCLVVDLGCSRRARSRRSPPGRCSSGCGASGRADSRWRS
ncbi:MAG: hypothetical protein ACRDM7_08655 [Thermoleophilaceae bacterium]